MSSLDKTGFQEMKFLDEMIDQVIILDKSKNVCCANNSALTRFGNDIEGKNIAKPIATILSLSMALRYSLDLGKEADQLDKAVQSVLDDGLRTKDIMSKNMKEVSTTEMGDAIIAKLK